MRKHFSSLFILLFLVSQSFGQDELTEVYKIDFIQEAQKSDQIDKRSVNWTESNLDQNGLVLKGENKKSVSTKSALVPINFSQPFEIETDFYTYPEFNKNFKGGLIIGLDHNMHEDDFPNYGLAFIITGKQGFEIINYKKEGPQLLAKDTSRFIEEITEADHILKIVHDGSSYSFYYDNIELIKIHNIEFHTVLRSGLMVQGKGSIHAKYFKVSAPEDPEWSKKLEKAEIRDKNIDVLKNPFFDNSIQNLGTAINSEINEIDPHISPDGKTLYFTKKGYQLEHVKDDEEFDFHDSFWYSTLDDSLQPGIAKLVEEPFNNEKRITGFNSTPDGQTILVQGRYNEHGTFLGEGFSLAHRSGNTWSDIEPIKIPGFSEINRGLFYIGFLASDGKTIFINCSKVPYSEHDDYRIFVSTKNEEGKWSKPQDLGPEINKPNAFTTTMFLAPDMKTLYFSSDGLPGYGDGDIFMCKRKGKSWTEWSSPKNLGPVVNGPYWDAYFTVPASGEYAYFVSYENTLGKADIFRVKLKKEVQPEAVMLVKGHVLDAATKKPIHASITVNDLNTDEQIATALSDPKTGFYELILPGKGAYSFFAEHPEYYSIRENLTLDSLDIYKENKKDLFLAPFNSGTNIKMNNIFFVQSKAELLDISYPELDKLVDIMLNENKTIRIRVEGHTDNQGSAYENLKLSKDRAVKVKEYLISKGVPASRLEAEGYGETKPIADNNNLETRKLNRRVEFVIID